MTEKKGADVTPHARPLWAPWRLEYITGEKHENCFFCEKGEGEDIVNHVIARGKFAFVLLNTFPYNSGHVLIAPYRHVGDLVDLDANERSEVMDLAGKTECVMRDTIGPAGFNFGFNIGDAAGAGVADHLHGHIVPRWQGDTNFMPVLADCRVVPQSLHATAAILRDAWRRLYGQALA